MFELLPHTADVRVRVKSSSVGELFEDAGRAVMALCEITTMPDTIVAREVRIDSSDQASLLVDFLNELVTVLHVDRLSFIGFDTVAITDTTLEGRVRFVESETWAEDIKAVTYHDVAITYEDDSWCTTIVVDI